MLTIEEKISRLEHFAKLCEQSEWREECEQLAAWLRELQEIRKDRSYWQVKAHSYEQTIHKLTDAISKQPEIVRCGECTHYIPILSNWGKCGVHSSPTEKYRTCQSCDYCSWAEKREEESKWVKNPYVQCRYLLAQKGEPNE